MKLLTLLSLAGACALAASARGQGADQPPSFLEGFPPDAVPVPGAPGAMTYPDLPPGHVLIHGDIQVPLNDYLVYLAGGDATFVHSAFWPGGIVPYDFDGNVTPENRQRAIDAMTDIQGRTGVTFRAAVVSDMSRIRFNSSNANNSPVGWGFGVRTINMVSWGSHFTIVHEIYHSLGFWHEQSAPGRDTFVTINYANICNDCCGGGSCAYNFDIESGASTYGGYDFDSFMHYSRGAFSGNGLDTITVNQPWNAQWQNAIGQHSHFSFWDELVCRGIYRYDTDRWWEAGAGGSGSLPSPIGGSLPGRMSTLPAGTTLFIKEAGSYTAIGTYTNPITLRAPLGATLGN